MSHTERITTRRAGALALLLVGSGALAAPITLKGAGATFPQPLYARMFEQYSRDTNGTVRVVYNSVDSAAGRILMTNGNAMFGATDTPMTGKAGSDALVQVPTALGAVAIVHHVPGVNQPLRFTGDVLAQIFLGKITTWNNAAITKLNEGVKLPAKSILVVHQTDLSGSTAVLNNYFLKVSTDWKSRFGQTNEVRFPVGIPTVRGADAAEKVAALPGSIGYMELTYAVKKQLTVAAVQNKQGIPITPSLPSITAAAASVPLPAEGFGSITDAPQGYPISSYSYVVVRQDLKQQKGVTQKDAQALKDLLGWMLVKGQQFGPELSYAPLPSETVERARKQLARLTYGGSQLK